jgi:hypothetical protein
VSLFTQARLAFLGLFTWWNLPGYLSSRLVQPIAFTALFAGAAVSADVSPLRTVVGGSLLATCSGTTFGMTLMIGNDLEFGTMDYRLLTGQASSRTWLSFALSHFLETLAVTLITGTVALRLFGLPIPVDRWGLVLAAVSTAALTGIGLGMLSGALVLRGAQLFVPPNLIALALLVFSGAMAPQSAVLGRLSALWNWIPLANAVQAGIGAVRGSGPGWAGVGREAVMAAVLIVAGTASLRAVLARRYRTTT